MHPRATTQSANTAKNISRVKQAYNCVTPVPPFTTMPYKHEGSGKLIPKDRDRRVVLTPEIKEEIIIRHKSGESIRSMSRMLGIDRRTIDFFLFPEKAEQNKQRRIERGGSKIYYNKQYNNQKVKEYRQYKKILDDKNLLVETNEEESWVFHKNKTPKKSQGN